MPGRRSLIRKRPLDKPGFTLLDTRFHSGWPEGWYSTTKEEIGQPPVSQLAKLRPTQEEFGTKRLEDEGGAGGLPPVLAVNISERSDSPKSLTAMR